jgi:glycosyltransferase involved in cell wall biosynthesis
LCKVLTIIRRWEPDIIHFLGENNIWLNLALPLLKGTPIVTTVHDVEFHPGDTDSQRIPRFFINSFIRQSDFIVVHGENLRAAAQEKLPVESVNLRVFPHIPLSYYKRLNDHKNISKPNHEYYKILFFGRIFKYKGLQYLIDAAPSILEKVPHARFIVAGTGDAEMLSELKKLPPETFEIRGRFIPNEEVALLFNEADLLVLPYVEASQSGVLMMATPFGLPVVVTDVGEMAAVVRDLKLGLVVPACDHGALADAISEIATRADLKQEFRRNAISALRGPLSPVELASKAKEMYKQISDDFADRRASPRRRRHRAEAQL